MRDVYTEDDSEDPVVSSNQPFVPLPAGIAAGLLGSFLLWYSLTDYQRARYFPWIAGAAATAAALYGIFSAGKA
jgi:hypothetical protein